MDTRRLIARYISKEPVWSTVALESAPVVKTAAFPPQFEKGGPPPGLEEGGSGGSKRDIPKDHPYDPKFLKPLAQSLWAASVSLGHALTAYKHLNRLKSASISPDGMLGGRGYIMNVAEMRKRLYEACESLSAITDTLHDEVNAPHWKPKLAQLDEQDAEDVERFVQESEEILENPEEDAEEDEEEVASGKKDKKSDLPKKDKASELPAGGNASPADVEKHSTPMMQPKEASIRISNSSVPVGTLPGPRVEHLDREDPPEQSGPAVSDDWGTPGPREYDYTSEWENNLSEKGAQSAVPDSTTDDTPTDAWDFGLGYGAKGDGAGGYENPSNEGKNKGVWGPTSGLPGVAPQSSGDDATLEVDRALKARDLMPGDLDLPVARSDYYRGDRGNLVNTQSTLPGEPRPSGELAPSMMNTDYSNEDLSTPYVRYDYTTHDYRDDPLHEWPQSHQAGMNDG